MKITSRPAPVIEAMAPTPSLRESACWLAPPSPLSRMTPSCVGMAKSSVGPTRGASIDGEARERSGEGIDVVADPNVAGLDHLRVYPELQPVLGGHAAVVADHVERGEVTQAGVRVQRGDHAAGNRFADADDGVPDPDATPGPRVLLVRLRDAVDLDRHTEATGVERAVVVAAFGEHRHRFERYEGDRFHVERVAGPVGPSQPNLVADVPAERLLEPAADRVCGHRPAVEIHLERLIACLGASRNHDPVRQPELELVALLVVLGVDRQDRRLGGAREPLPRPVHEEEAAVAGRALGAEMDALGVVQRRGLDRRHVEPRDPRHAPTLPRRSVDACVVASGRWRPSASRTRTRRSGDPALSTRTWPSSHSSSAPGQGRARACGRRPSPSRTSRTSRWKTWATRGSSTRSAPGPPMTGRRFTSNAGSSADP